MNEPLVNPKLPEIPEAEQTPLVRSLLRIIHQQQAWIEHLEEEIRDLKGGPKKPQLKPSRLEGKGRKPSGEGRDGDEQGHGKRRGKPQRRKTERLTIHETQRVEAQGVPPEAVVKRVVY